MNKYKRNDYSNIPPSIEAKIGRNLHLQKNHPVEIMKRKLFDYFKTLDGYDFDYFDNLSPFATIINTINSHFSQVLTMGM